MPVHPYQNQNLNKMVEVYVSNVIQANCYRIWQVVRDFNSLPIWHPLIADSRIETGSPADQIGCIRHFSLKDGGTIREQLLALSDYDCFYSYSILESPLAVSDYIATLKLIPITETDHCFVEWKASFHCHTENKEQLQAQVENIFQTGFTALKHYFGKI